MASYAGLASHPFPTCFSCGTGREPGRRPADLPGPGQRRVGEDGEEPPTRVAATWTPDPTVAEDYHAYVDEQPRASLPVTWAALDCVGGWAGDLEERLMVLARMTARLDSLPVIGEEHVLVGMGRGHEGRKTWTPRRCTTPTGVWLPAPSTSGSPSTPRRSTDMAAADPAPWWRDAVFYQVYVRSFADSDGDGLGDIPGITSRLRYLRDLGVDAVWITPFYPSPQHDAGYDVADYTDIDPRFGRLARRRRPAGRRRTTWA